MIMEFIYLIVGIVIGFVIAWLLARTKNNGSTTALQQQLFSLTKEKDAVIVETDKAKSIAEDRYNILKTEYDKNQSELRDEREKSQLLNNRISKAETEFRNMQQKLCDQKAEMEELQKKFTTEFENIANKILKTHTQEFAQSGLKSMGEILNPLKEKDSRF